MKHPIHPAIVHFPIGLFLASLIFDCLAKFSSSTAFFPVASFYCMLFGIIAGLVAAVPGLLDFRKIASGTQPKRLAATHMILNVIVIALYAVNLFLRQATALESTPIVPTPLFVFSIVTFGVLGISGYLGGLMVYEHGIGMRRKEAVPGSTRLRRVS